MFQTLTALRIDGFPLWVLLLICLGTIAVMVFRELRKNK